MTDTRWRDKDAEFERRAVAELTRNPELLGKPSRTEVADKWPDPLPIQSELPPVQPFCEEALLGF